MAAAVPPSMIAALGVGAVPTPVTPAPAALPEQSAAAAVESPSVNISREAAVKKALDSAGGAMK